MARSRLQPPGLRRPLPAAVLAFALVCLARLSGQAGGLHPGRAACFCSLPSAGVGRLATRATPRSPRTRPPRCTAVLVGGEGADRAEEQEVAGDPSMKKRLRSAATIFRRLVNIPLSWNGLALFPTFYILGYLSQVIHDLQAH
uniref:Uncharacterized protein n=1 Tax=Alexandrium andersonii TaxID=327968 RepID=A0A7S2BRM0_9DINO